MRTDKVFAKNTGKCMAREPKGKPKMKYNGSKRRRV